MSTEITLRTEQSGIVENKIKKMNKGEIGRMFQKLEPNAMPYDQNERDEILRTIDEGEKLTEENYLYIAKTYKTHINELLPEIEMEQDSVGLIPYTMISLVVGILLRIALNSTESTVMILMGAINVLAIGLTLFIVAGNINNKVKKWIDKSLILDDDKKKLLSRYKTKKYGVVIVAFVIEVVILAAEIVLYCIDLQKCMNTLALGNDLISIVAFGFALFCDDLESYLVRKFECKLSEVEL